MDVYLAEKQDGISYAILAENEQEARNELVSVLNPAQLLLEGQKMTASIDPSKADAYTIKKFIDGKDGTLDIAPRKSDITPNRWIAQITRQNKTYVVTDTIPKELY